MAKNVRDGIVVTSLQFVTVQSFGQLPLPCAQRSVYTMYIPRKLRARSQIYGHRSKLLVNSRITGKWWLLGMQVSDI